MEETLRKMVVNLTDEETAKKAEIVAARAAILVSNDQSIDLASLIQGLWIGHQGEMPETLHLGVLGIIQTIALAKIEEYGVTAKDPSP